MILTKCTSILLKIDTDTNSQEKKKGKKKQEKKKKAVSNTSKVSYRIRMYLFRFGKI